MQTNMQDDSLSTRASMSRPVTLLTDFFDAMMMRTAQRLDFLLSPSSWLWSWVAYGRI